MNPATSQWDIVKELRPVKLDDVSLVDRMVREEVWTFAHNQVTGQHMRVYALARLVLHALDGSTTVEDILQSQSTNADVVEKEALAVSLISLSQQGMVHLADASHEARLQARIEQQALQGRRIWHNPLAIRIPLFDPDKLLTRLNSYLEFVSGKHILVIALSVMFVALIAVVLNVQDVIIQLQLIASTPQQWWQLALLYPLLKCIHELAHAVAIKRWGGEVHELGITVLVLMPIPYVDASDSWGFERRYQRILVSAAGILAESTLAAIGMLIWLLVEPGVLSNFGFAVALTVSASTLLFNANPLLKFDGYQILQDVLDMPNLAPRATRYLHYLMQRYLLKINTAVSPVTADGEHKWLLIYGLCAAAYRWVVTLGIALYLTSRIPVLGAFLALFALFQLAIRPFLRAMTFLSQTTDLEGRRIRTAGCLGLWIGVGLAVLILVPVPTNTRAQGIVGLPTQAEIYAPESGELGAIVVEQGQRVLVDQIILKIDAPDLETRLVVTRAELDDLLSRYQAALVNDVVASQLLFQDVQQLRSRLVQLESRVDSLSVRSMVDGTIGFDQSVMVPGQFVNAGDALGFVVNSSNLLVRAVVAQSDISRVREGVNNVRIRLAERFSEPLDAQLAHETPAADRTLPSQALAYNGHSGIAVASNSENQWTTVEPIFHIEFSLPASTATVGIGGRAYVTMNHKAESIGQRSWRTVRQLLLDTLAI